MKQNESALVCLSGGQDSTTCLYWALKEFRHVETVCFSYGQKHALEVDVARRIAEKASVDFSLLDLSLLGQITHNALTDNAVSMDKEKPAEALPNTFVPGRNMLFLTLAAIKAYERGIGHLVTGVSQTDFSGYPDCRDTFIRSLNVSSIWLWTGNLSYIHLLCGSTRSRNGQWPMSWGYLIWYVMKRLLAITV